jgi:hypothetical protein
MQSCLLLSSYNTLTQEARSTASHRRLQPYRTLQHILESVKPPVARSTQQKPQPVSVHVPVPVSIRNNEQAPDPPTHPHLLTCVRYCSTTPLPYCMLHTACSTWYKVRLPGQLLSSQCAAAVPRLCSSAFKYTALRLTRCISPRCATLRRVPCWGRAGG